MVDNTYTVVLVLFVLLVFGSLYCIIVFRFAGYEYGDVSTGTTGDKEYCTSSICGMRYSYVRGLAVSIFEY